MVKHYDILNPTDPLETVTFIDGFGRTIQTKKETDVDNGAGGVTHGFSVSGPTIFDERGRVQSQGMPVFNTDADNQLSTVTLTRATQYQYDILSRPTLVIEPNNTTISTSYTFGLFDGVQRFITTVTDPNNNKRLSYQDVRGQVVGVDQFNTIAGVNRTLTTRYSYDPLGELLQVTDAKGNKTTSVYDTVGHLVDLTSPDSGHVSYRYDLPGRLIAKQTPNLVTGNQVILYAYDFNRLKSMDLPSTAGVIDYQYTYGDPLSLPSGMPGEVGRLIHIKDPSGDEARFYDELGRMDSSQFFPTPQATTAPKPSYTTGYKYDSLNRLLALTYPDGEVVSYGYDGGGAMTSVSGKFAASTTVTPYVQKITYDEFGQRKSITLGNGVVTKYSYDPNMRWLSDINTVTGATTVQNNHYTFDNVGNILTAANNIAIPAPVPANGPIAPGPTSQTFTYDNLYQLTSATGRYDGCACGCNNFRKYTYAQSYDEIGNIKTKAVTDNIFWPSGRIDVQPKTTYNNAYTYGSPRPHAPTKIGVQNLAYDGDGNQTASTGTFEVGREVTWNELDQLTKEVDSSFTNTFIYNSAGERTHKRRTSLETVYVNPYYVIRSLLFQTKHIYAGPTRILSATVTLNDFRKLTTTQTPILFYYHSDQLGSTGYITDRTGQILEHEEYLPSGESWIEELKNGSGSNRLPWQFNAKELDETGLYYYGARYYNPRAGVWMSPDPILDQYMRGVRGVSEPRNLGLYTYSWNNPVTLRDPNGMCVEDFCVGEAAAVGAFLTTPTGQRLVQAVQVGAVAAAGALAAAATTLWTKISGGDAPPPPNTPAPAPAPAPGSQPPAGPPPAVPPGAVPLAAGAAAAANSPGGRQALQEGADAAAETGEAAAGAVQNLAEGVEAAAARSFTRLESLSGNASSRLVDQLAKSMKASGWRGPPIKVFENNGVKYVLDGHHRLAAAMRAGVEVQYERVQADQLIQYGYKSVSDLVHAAAETVPNKIR